MKTYSLLVVKGTMIEEFIQNLDPCLLVSNLPDQLGSFKEKILSAAREGAGHYGLGYINGSEVHMIVVEYGASTSLFRILIIAATIAFATFWLLRRFGVL